MDFWEAVWFVIQAILITFGVAYLLLIIWCDEFFRFIAIVFAFVSVIAFCISSITGGL